MISVSEAQALIEARSAPLAPLPAVLADALGLVLAEDVASDIDSPPYDKALVDGYAVIAADCRRAEATVVGSAGRTKLAGAGTTGIASAPQLRTADPMEVLEEVVAGAVPTQPLTPGTATRIMTGAPLP